MCRLNPFDYNSFALNLWNIWMVNYSNFIWQWEYSIRFNNNYSSLMVGPSIFSAQLSKSMTYYKESNNTWLDHSISMWFIHTDIFLLITRLYEEFNLQWDYFSDFAIDYKLGLTNASRKFPMCKVHLLIDLKFYL